MTRIDGKKYFAAVEHELNLSGLAPDKVQQLRAQGGLKRGSVESRLGGRITRDLKYLSPTEVERRRELSEEFLKQPVEEVAEEGEA